MEDVARFTFLGFLQKENRKIIFLSRNNEIILVRKGDKIAGRYEVVNISNEALTISLLQSGEQVVIPLLENKALAPNPSLSTRVAPTSARRLTAIGGRIIETPGQNKEDIPLPP
jgi:hypothetical protein